MDSEKPFFKINGYDFHVDVDATSESEINLVVNKMFVPTDYWGYNDIQWTNFTGNNIDLRIYSRITEVYNGEKAQPENGGIEDFYSSDKTPHAVLKYWSETFVPCVVYTNLQAYENGTYVISELKQKNLTYDFVETTLQLKLYEKPTEIIQTYWKSSEEYKNTDTSNMTAVTYSFLNMTTHHQTCDCNEYTPAEQCTASEEEDVKMIQTWLQKWGYFPTYSKTTGNITPNGKYCYHTTQAIHRFQEAMGIPESGDFTEETKLKFLEKIGSG